MRPKYSLDEVSQEIDLSEVLGRNPSEVEAREFLDEAINLIMERTQAGFDINGRAFKQYSEDYAQFKGVSRGDVDLTLTSAMLAGTAGEVDGSRVKLFVEADQVPKAYNHNVGDTLPKRTYFGLTTEEIESIAGGIGVANVFEQRQQLDIAEIIRNIGFIVDED
jgi:hypothetical protein